MGFGFSNTLEFAMNEAKIIKGNKEGISVFMHKYIPFFIPSWIMLEYIGNRQQSVSKSILKNKFFKCIFDPDFLFFFNLICFLSFGFIKFKVYHLPVNIYVTLGDFYIF